MTGNDDGLHAFENAAPRLRAMAYRMLGVIADADDVVQEVWVRWSAVDRTTIRVADAWLNTVTSRLALDALRRRKHEQVDYVGPWLPQPIVSQVGDPEATAELADSLTLSFLILLEELTPDERAAFLMADVFAEPSSAIAATLDRSEVACRQLASRARRKLNAAQAHIDVAPADRARHVVDAFVVAITAGDEAEALKCLHPNVCLVSDGGAHRRAARRPVLGGDRVVRLMLNLARRVDPTWVADAVSVGGLPGFRMSVPAEPAENPASDIVPLPGTVMLMAFRVVGNQIAEVFNVLNPDKLSAQTPIAGQ